MNMAENEMLICYRCQIELKPQKTHFNYLGHNFFTTLLRCPECGEVYIPKDLVKGRISDVEMQLEDK